MELLEPLDKPWVNQLRGFALEQKTDRLQRVALLSYFDLMTELARHHSADNVVEYAVGRLWRAASSGEIVDYNHLLLVSLVLQILTSKPHASVECYQLLLLLMNKGVQLDPALLGLAVNTVIEANAPLGHGSEVAWAVWAAMAFSLKIEAAAATALGRSMDDVVAILALDAEYKGLIPGGLDHTLWEPFMSTAELEGEHWLLAYQVNVSRWLPSTGGGDHVAGHAVFGPMKQAGVSFYDPTHTVPGKPLKLHPPEPRVGSP